jgi:anti-sigma factor ChrR (cupin superfamily)
MMNDENAETFDDALALALARSVQEVVPPPAVKARLMARIEKAELPSGFSLNLAASGNWLPHMVPGIRMRVLAVNAASGYATLLLDVAPGTRFPAHRHGGAEECYVVSGSLFTCNRRLGPGDFVHADAGTEHPELWTDEGCVVILVAPRDEHLPQQDAP